MVLMSADGAEGGAVAEAPATAANSEAKPDLAFEVCEITEGPLKNFKFNVPVWNDFDAMTTKYGKERMLGLGNSVAAARIRTKVKNDNIPEFADDAKKIAFDSKNVAHINEMQKKLLLAHPDAILFSVAQATDWSPDLREMSPNQLFKQAKELFETRLPENIKKGLELIAKMQKIVQEDANSMLASAGATPATVAATA